MIAQLNALIAEIEACEYQGELFDTLMGLKEDRRVEETKLIGLNDLDKTKVVFSQARSADESFIELMRSLCSSLRLSLNKHRRLIAEMEALGQRGDALRSLDYMREMVVCDSATLGVL
nr:hypothetical protein [Tanacetum cinerariifolium]